MNRSSLRTLLPIPIVVSLLAASAHSASLLESGMPASDREWTGVDYAKASELISTGKVDLPTLATEEGRAFLQRLTSTENLNFYRNTTLPIGTRLQDLLTGLGGVSTIVKRYATEANKGGKLHTEVAMQLGYMLQVARAGVILIDEFFPTVPKDDKYETRMAGLKQVSTGLIQMFAGAETSLGETKFYSAEDLSLLLRNMAEVLPIVKKNFSPGYVVELRQNLERHKAAFPGKEDAANLQKMIDELKQ
jgi:hypothetical protein